MLQMLILEDADWQKLQIMAFFATQPDGIYSINTICSELKLAYTTASTLSGEISAELADLLNYRLIRKDGKICWRAEAYHHNAYIQYLVRNSLCYNFVLTSLVEPEKSFEDFCSQLFLSHSTVLRKLRPLKELLTRFHLKLLATKMHILGNEATLRMFYITYLWVASHGEDMRLSGFDFSQEEQLMVDLGWQRANFMLPQTIVLGLTVNRLRYSQGHLLADLPYLPPTPMVNLEQVRSYTTGFITNTVQQHMHTYFLSYLLYFTPYYLEEADFRVQDLARYFDELKLRQDPLTLLVEEFESCRRI